MICHPHPLLTAGGEGTVLGVLLGLTQLVVRPKIDAEMWSLPTPHV